MAETSAKNEAFLKQMERQRLGKLCNRAIDLRGKVPGECRVYEFGGKKHYLDDRGYLLAKQLLDRFNGRYTIGVYETVLKALKKLASNDDNVAERESDKPILLRDENHVQFMRFDQEVKRKEPRLTTVTPVHLSINDVVYQGSTIDITTSAIRVSLKRASTISSGIEINVSLPEIAEKSDISSFTKITYKVLKISHDELRTQLVLLRNRHDNPAVTKWLDNWIARKQSPEHLDLNNELYNLTNRIYMRLYNETRSKPLFWLTPTADIDTLHLTTSAAAHLTALRDDSGSFIFSRLPLAELPLHAEQFLLAVNSEGYAVASATDTEKLKQLVAWKNQNSNGFLLLLNQSARLIDEDDLAEFEEELEALNKYNTDYAEKFKQNILTQHRVISITDITDSFNYIHVDSPIAELTTHGDTPVDIATPKEFNHFINRTVERYTIRTEVRARVNGKAYNLKTNDASEAGLSITLPEYVDLLPDTRINLDFTRWQAMAKETRLRGIQFRAKWIKYWQGQTILGLAR